MTSDSFRATRHGASRPRILLVDDDRRLVNELAPFLRRAGVVVVTACEGCEAIGQMESAAFDVIVSDIELPCMDGLSLLRAIRSRDLDVPVVFLTGGPTLETAIEANEYGAFRYLRKPIDLEQLITVVEQSARAHRLALARRETSQESDGKAVFARPGRSFLS